MLHVALRQVLILPKVIYKHLNNLCSGGVLLFLFVLFLVF